MASKPAPVVVKTEPWCARCALRRVERTRATALCVQMVCQARSWQFFAYTRFHCSSGIWRQCGTDTCAHGRSASLLSSSAMSCFSSSLPCAGHTSGMRCPNSLFPVGHAGRDERSRPAMRAGTAVSHVRERCGDGGSRRPESGNHCRQWTRARASTGTTRRLLWKLPAAGQ